MRSKNSPRRPSRMEYVIARITPASAKSGATMAGRGAGAGIGFLGASTRAVGGIDRAGVTSVGRGGATCFSAIGDGTGSGFGRASAVAAWCARAGAAAVARRDRVTAGAGAALGNFADTL